MEITREIFFNIHSAALFVYILAIIVVAIFVWGLYQRICLWKVGKKENRTDQIRKRIKSVLWFGLGHRRILDEAYPGIFHLLLFWGFVILFLGTAVIFLQYDILKPIFKYFFLYGDFYLWFSLILDVSGALAIIGALLALYRRFILKPKRLDNIFDDGFSLILISLVLVTGFITEGFRIAATRPYFEVWSFFGWQLAKLFNPSWTENSSLLFWHKIFWWIHVGIAFFFIGYLAYSKLLHIFSSSLSQFFRSLKPLGALKPIPDMENAETFGVSKVEEFTWRQLLDADACTRCGRCQDNCPAYLSEKPLSPKKIIQDLKSNLVLSKRILSNNPEKKDSENKRPALIGESILEDELWACTTCFACQQTCPVFVEHVDKVVDMRRYLVLMESKFPQEVKLVFKNMETNYNPWALGFASRGDWAKDLGVKILSEDKNVDILCWVGCAGSFDDRNKKVSRAMVKILQTAKINFGILGSEEKCCGETARRLGNEYLASILIQGNIEVLKHYGIKKILTTCPHGYNTFKNEYPQFGGEFEVIHHTDFILDLLKNGKIKTDKKLSEGLVYHDSCYLGRYNQIYDSPRDILKSVSSGKFFEMEKRKEKSFCCGAGGGRMWMEEKLGRRINQLRVEQAKKTSAQTIATACPFCLTMLGDGIKEKNWEEVLKAKDIAELVAECL
jgi:Fe-S oxidoreductase/nitrate reductase gamma subunit